MVDFNDFKKSMEEHVAEVCDFDGSEMTLNEKEMVWECDCKRGCKLAYNLVNLTPHAITLYKFGKMVLEIKPSGFVARSKANKEVVNTINGFPLYEVSYDEADLPASKEHVLYIVSFLVVQTNPDRKDLIAPDTSDAVRDDRGNVIGVKGFQGREL